MLSIWGTTKYISKWKMAHRRGYHINCLTDDPERKAMIMQHELDCKTSVRDPNLIPSPQLNGRKDHSGLERCTINVISKC